MRLGKKNRTAAGILGSLLFFAASCGATTLTGTVTNGTTGKPSAGDEVILIKLSSGMEEAAHTKSDAQGKFSFTLDDPGMHLIRAVHQGVTYHQPAPPGTSSVDVTVYDAGTKIDGVRAVADLMYVQASQGKIGFTRVFAVDNSSKPPRTEMNDADFEFYVPDGAEIDEAEAQTSGGQPVKVQPAPQAEKDRYAFVFPLRPGQTQFQVTYHLAYSGKATVDPRLVYPLEHFVVILPRSLGFTPQQAGVYEDKQPPDQPDGIAEVARSPQPGSKLAFDVSGEGMLQNQDQQANGHTSAPADDRPGGGLGAPIEGSDPMDKYRYWIIGGFGLILVTGAIYTMNRSRASAIAGASPSGPVPAPTLGSSPSMSVPPSSGGLLDGLKEELFQLELEHAQGQISDEEYAKTKAALSQTLARAVKRKT